MLLLITKDDSLLNTTRIIIRCNTTDIYGIDFYVVFSYWLCFVKSRRNQTNNNLFLIENWSQRSDFNNLLSFREINIELSASKCKQNWVFLRIIKFISSNSSQEPKMRRLFANGKLNRNLPHHIITIFLIYQAQLNCRKTVKKPVLW